MAEEAASDAPRTEGLKRLARLAGRLLTAAALLFLAWEIHRQWGKISDWRPAPWQLGAIAGFCLLHGVALYVQARNWLTLIRALVPEPPPAKAVLLSFTDTQIAKYVPGNVLHFVGRHFYLKGYGVAHKPIVAATLLEIAGLPVAAVTAVCLLAPFADWSGVGYHMADFAPYLPVLAVVFFGLGTLLLMHLGHRAIVLPAMTVLARAVVFMLFQGGIFAATLWVIGGSFIPLAMPLAIVAWLVGFLTPGAPGGMGVREALLVTLLAGTVAPDMALIAVLMFRIVTVAGDFVLFATGRLLLKGAA